MNFSLLSLKNYPIYDQLLLEEELLRNDHRNLCLINVGSPPAIVMGISGKADQLIHLDNVTIPIIRRFSGGGTVVVDENTVFVTFICNKADHPFPAYPEPILRFAETILAPTIPGLILRENDFVIGEKKCGGNALYIKKDRWLLHTSFLWDYHPAHMDLLKHPPKTPTYRQGRTHEHFLCRLSDRIEHQDKWIQNLKKIGSELEEISRITLNQYGTSIVFHPS